MAKNDKAALTAIESMLDCPNCKVITGKELNELNRMNWLSVCAHGQPCDLHKISVAKELK